MELDLRNGSHPPLEMELDLRNGSHPPLEMEIDIFRPLNQLSKEVAECHLLSKEYLDRETASIFVGISTLILAISEFQYPFEGR